MPVETVRDNQWWFSKSALRPHVENCAFLVLSVGGRDCPLVRSRLGSDGRPTYSFKFLNPADRAFWISLRGSEIEVEVIECRDQLPEIDQADEMDQVDRRSVPHMLEAPTVSRSCETLFDAYIFADWSASSRPKQGKDSIWIGTGAYNADGALIVDRPINPRTRRLAEATVHEMLCDHVQSHRRVLIGFDFPYGYPSEWHTAVGVSGRGGWQSLWNLFAKRIKDDKQNQNNRCSVANALNAASTDFVGPFWTKPNGNDGVYPALSATKPPCFLERIVEFRGIEQHLRSGGRHPKSVWQLFGNGVVGSQALLGIPVLHRLRYDEKLESCSQVWPFETGWKCPVGQRPLIIHAEIWPGAIDVTRGLHQIKDAAQVLSYVYWAARHDVTGILSPRFNPQVADPALVIQQYEGWILAE
jgi:hypothetical protein